MSVPRKKNPLRKGPQQKNQYHYILGNPLHLVKLKDTAAQENRLSKTQHNNILAGGRRSTDKDALGLYHLWDSLSAREKDVAILVCRKFTNEQIAQWTKLSISTVKSYLQHVFFKLNVRSKIELYLKFGDLDFKRNTPPYI